MNPITIFGEDIIDLKTVAQLENCMLEDSIGVLTPDAHYGYAHPIGGAIAYKDHISVSGVGFDIGCGNKAVRTDIKANEITVSSVMDEIVKRISFGMGRANNEKADHWVIEAIGCAKFKPQRKLQQLAANQLGTVGGGNHFVDLFSDEEGWLWIGVHFGSRGFGHKTATGFMALAQGLGFEDKGSQGPMDGKPLLLDVNSELGIDYLNAMQLAGEYAYAGRDMVVNKVLEILGNPTVTLEVHNHHNFAWLESHGHSNYWVVRKGCTPAFPGQLGFIGANMMDSSVIVEGRNSLASERALFSTVHGAGRVMSRTAAVGKSRWKKGEDGKKRREKISEGCVDFENVCRDMWYRGIELRGAGGDEAPQCYKNLAEVLSYMDDNIVVKHVLDPIGVAMAGDEYDPYKD